MLQFWNPDSLSYVVDWQAWATFVTGIAAVTGAVLVARRQAGISERQTEIADRQAQIMERQTDIQAQQVEIEQIRLRSELYERREAIYNAFDRYVEDALSPDEKVDREVHDRFLDALVSSRYLLSLEIQESARAIFWEVNTIRSNMQRQKGNVPSDIFADLEMKIGTSYNKVGDLAKQIKESKVKFLGLIRDTTTKSPNIRPGMSNDERN